MRRKRSKNLIVGLAADQTYLETLDQDNRLLFLRKIHDLVARLKPSKYNDVSKVKFLQNEIDKQLEKGAYQHAVCKKGCNFCCHLHVRISKPEAALALKAAKDKGINLDMELLAKQAALPDDEPETYVGFARQGECFPINSHMNGMKNFNPSNL